MDPAEFMRMLAEQIRTIIREETRKLPDPPPQHQQVQSQYGQMKVPAGPAVVQVYRVMPDGDRVVVATTTAQLLAEACDILLDISDSLTRERPRRRKRTGV